MDVRTSSLLLLLYQEAWWVTVKLLPVALLLAALRCMPAKQLSAGRHALLRAAVLMLLACAVLYCAGPWVGLAYALTQHGELSRTALVLLVTLAGVNTLAAITLCQYGLAKLFQHGRIVWRSRFPSSTGA